MDNELKVHVEYIRARLDSLENKMGDVRCEVERLRDQFSNGSTAIAVLQTRSKIHASAITAVAVAMLGGLMKLFFL